jgi:archaellum component FlaF (FlaF/FlaG flagellin family)
MNFFASFTTGKLIMIVSLLMFIALVYFFIRDFYGKVVEEVKDQQAKPIEPVVVASLQKTHQLEEVINQKIANMKLDLMAERLRITSTAEVLKNLANERHLPETLYQIYFETRAFPKKSLEAQQTDLEWHAQAGITELKV